MFAKLVILFLYQSAYLYILNRLYLSLPSNVAMDMYLYYCSQRSNKSGIALSRMTVIFPDKFTFK